MLAQTASQAEESILHLTYTFRTSEEEEEMRPLLDVVESKAREGKISIRFLGPDHKRLDGLYVRAKRGAEVKVNTIIHTYDTRFQVVDGKLIVITVGDPATESRKGYLVESEVLGGILSREFESLWNKEDSIFYDDHVRQTICQVVANLNEAPTLNRISDKLCLPIGEVERVFKTDSTLKLIGRRLYTLAKLEKLISDIAETEKGNVEAAVREQLSLPPGEAVKEVKELIQKVISKSKSPEGSRDEPSG